MDTKPLFEARIAYLDSAEVVTDKVAISYKVMKVDLMSTD